MRCFYCDKEFKDGERVYEIQSGIYDGEMIFGDESIEVWCEACDEKRGEK